jgi:hypothetical protein
VIVVACFKWGSAFTADRVNLLFRAVRDRSSVDLSYVCLTDDPNGLDDFIEAKAIPEMGLKPENWRDGCWPKLSIFKPGLFPGAEAVIFIDLDMMVLADIAPFAERVKAMGGLHILREWNPFVYNVLPVAWRPYRGAQSALFGFRPGEMDYVFETFCAAPEAELKRAHNDQSYLSVAARKIHHWPHDWCVSFRRHCAWYWPLSLVFSPTRPRRARIVVFHGKPRPWDLVQAEGVRWGTSRKFGYKPVGWVLDYFRKYGFGAPEGAGKSG